MSAIEDAPTPDELFKLAQATATAAIAEATVDEINEAIAALEGMADARAGAAVGVGIALELRVPAFLRHVIDAARDAGSIVDPSTMLVVLTLLVGAHADVTAQAAARRATQLGQQQAVVQQQQLGVERQQLATEQQQLALEQQIKEQLNRRVPALAKKAVEQARPSG